MTRTMTNTTATAMYFDTTTNAVNTEEITLAGLVDDKAIKALRKAYKERGHVFLKLDAVKSIDSIWEVDENVFLEHAFILEKRNSAIKLVTRTARVNVVDVTYFDTTTNAIATEERKISGEVNDKAIKALRKVYESDGKVFCNYAVKGWTDTTYAMTESDFLKLAQPCTTRKA